LKQGWGSSAQAGRYSGGAAVAFGLTAIGIVFHLTRAAV
jgi:hypothetical protein